MRRPLGGSDAPTLPLYLQHQLANRLAEARDRALEDFRRRHDAEQADSSAAAASARPRSAKAPINVEQVRVPNPDAYRGIEFPVYGPDEPVEMLARSRSMGDPRDQERIEEI